MTLERRDVLKGLALAGLSGMISSRFASAMMRTGDHFPAAKSAATLHLLVSGSSQSEAFLEGAGASARLLGARISVLRLNNSIAENLTRVNELLRTRPTCIALVGPADGVLLQELARGNGLRLSCIGHHAVGGAKEIERHHFTTTSQSAGLGSCIQSGLGSQGFQVTEKHLGAEAGQRKAVTPIASASSGERRWAALLGGSLAQVAYGNWTPEAAGRPRFRFSASRGGERAEDLTSLLIQG